ncbi:MAG TPA: nucleotide sugar dehydrogenase [Terriglobia bacterium]|nr:nucleotide sugar dehydrogenase [Terriglobia bacterium]
MPIEGSTGNGQEALTFFQRRLDQKTARVGVVGLGYVGLPLALLFSGRGFETVGLDIDPAKVDSLLRGESYIHHIPAATIREQVGRGRFTATVDFAAIETLDACIICVPTPLDEYREPDLSFVSQTTGSVSAHLRPNQLVVLESTTYPGTTEELVLPILERSGLRCAVQPYDAATVTAESCRDVKSDFMLAFSPEREDPGNKTFQTHQVPKVVGGVNPPSALAARALYAQAFECTVLVGSSRVAEMTKLLENIYRCVNIALINELKLLCLRMDIDVWEVIEAAKTKPFGFTPFYPGPGLGGHCIPIDPFYLTWKARAYELPTRFIELAGEINSSMPGHAVEAVGEALNRRGTCFNGSAILVLGIAYKKDIDDLRESPSLRIIELLQERGARVDYHDPFFPRLHKMRRYDLGLTSVELTAETLARFEAVVIVTDHSSYDYEFIARHSKLVIDTRNATQGLRHYRDKIVRC